MCQGYCYFYILETKTTISSNLLSSVRKPFQRVQTVESFEIKTINFFCRIEEKKTELNLKRGFH